MASASTYTNTEVNPISGTSSAPPGTMTGNQLAVPNFSGMTDSQLSSYLSSGTFSTGGDGTTNAGLPTTSSNVLQLPSEWAVPSTSSAGTSSTTDSSGTSSSTDSSSFSSLLSSLLGGTSLGSVAEFGTLAGLGLSQANAAQQRTDQLASQLTNIGQPFTQAGEGILSEVSGKTPVDPNNPLSASIGQQIQTADTLSQIGQTELSAFQQGKLDPGMEATLQAQNVAQKAQVKQQLANAGITDSSVLDTQTQNIDNQTAIARESMLNTEEQVGVNALNQVQTTYSNLLNQSLSLSGFGSQLQSQAVQLQVQSDTQITAALTQLFGQIAQGFGQSMSGGKAGTGAGSGTASSTLGGVASKLVSSVGNLLGAGTGSIGAAASASADVAASQIGESTQTLTDQTASDIAASNESALQSQIASETGDVSLANPGLNAVGSAADASAADAASALSGIDASAADVGLQSVGTDAVNAAADASASDASSALSDSAAADTSGILGSAGQALAGAGAIYGLYNSIENYQSGDTGGDAARGAETGAAAGTAVLPGVGTAVGAAIGGAVGALSSAFGPGKTDPETKDWNSYLSAVQKNPAIASQVQNPFLMIAGLFDEKSSSLPMVQQYGRMGENKFTVDMTNQINAALQNGTITKSTPPAEVYQQVVAPWVANMGSGWSNVGPEYQQATQGLLKQMTAQYMSGQQTNWNAVGGDYAFSGGSQGTITPFGSAAPTAAPPPAPVAYAGTGGLSSMRYLQ